MATHPETPSIADYEKLRAENAILRERLKRYQIVSEYIHKVLLVVLKVIDKAEEQT